MNLLSPPEIKTLLEKYKTKPSKKFGQNFLIDKNVLEKIIVASDIKKDDTILEVGPGIGTLTQELAKHASKVIAVEKDRNMIEILKETLLGLDNVHIIEADILSYKLQVTSYKVVANIPYYLTSPLIRKFLESANQPEEIILMMQKEVAERITAKPPHMSILAVSVQFYATAKIILKVSKNCFWPAPKVDSAIIKITPTAPNSATAEFGASAELFFKIVKAGFSQPRKQIVGNLVKTLKMERGEVEAWLTKNSIAPTQRAETLSVQDWRNLTQTFVNGNF